MMGTSDVLETFLTQQKEQDVLRFITCGSVDDGKSTLIGRLLWDANQIFDDQLSALQKDSLRFGTQGDAIDYALLVDGLAAEREQGITIDVAYRFFATAKRKFIVADTPGHEQYTRNMVTGASTADVALILVDASQGLLPQTHRHAYLFSLMGIRHVALVVNKMDKVGYDEQVFRGIEADFRDFCAKLSPLTITAIPVSALAGENVIHRSNLCGWYEGQTLIEYLESVDVTQASADAPFIYPVQWVNRPHADFRGFAGTLASGQIKVGQEVRVTASGQTAQVARIVTMDGDLPSASTLDSVTLTLDREVDASRGDVLTLADAPVE
ncbi:MAG: hypothetical protein FJX23_08180, partial [Alphaproteobacteria bacterium]|nr:hypothetical protein [Alphaproteobacteria bacterium]